MTPEIIITESKTVRKILITIALGFAGLFLIVPLATVLMGAFGKGISYTLATIQDSATLSAIFLTLKTSLIVVPLNLLFGVAASWAIAKFDFVGKKFVMTLIDLPFTVSPVISGLIYVLLFGAQGLLGAWLIRHDIKIIFAVPGIVLATLFVTFPYVARELIPLMQSQGNDQEEAALTLGANGWQTFFRVTLPNIQWGLIYGVILLNARAMGEFGAVSVVSGHIRGLTNTIPLHVEILYNEYNLVGAFSVASLLALVAIGTLLAKVWVKWKGRQQELGLLEEGFERASE